MDKKQETNRIDEVFVTENHGILYDKVIAQTEKELIEKTLEKSFGNQSIAAKLLGINRNTLRLKIKKLGVEVENYKI